MSDPVPIAVGIRKPHTGQLVLFQHYKTERAATAAVAALRRYGIDALLVDADDATAPGSTITA